MKKTLLILVLTLFFTSCYRDVKKIKKAAPEFLKERGYEIVSYDGYQADFLAISGGLVGYQVRDKNGFLYTLLIEEWRGEFHIYNLTCLNAISSPIIK